MPEIRPRKAKAAKAAPNGSGLLAREQAAASPNHLVVGIGSSAGGLDACRKFLDALPADNGMAFILVQHLDPNHESLMVDLLAGHTSMAVLQATDGMPIEPDHLYIIPPGAYLSVAHNILKLSEPLARHGARLPFDFLLNSLSEHYGPRAACVILSGTGADGSLGVKAVKDKGGLVIAQDPAEAGFDGMPRNAILTGAVDSVLPVARIPEELKRHSQDLTHMPARKRPAADDDKRDYLPEIIDLLRTKTSHDFTLYKQGTLSRRIERRMAMAAIELDDTKRYLDLLKKDKGELDLLAKDLLINVTNFFRDPAVFDYLTGTIVPKMVRDHPVDQPMRIWVAGCSTGEETYSLAIVFQEQIAAAKRNIKLQIFASDVDADAVEAAREGLYPDTIAADMSPERLARFFSKEDNIYRIASDLRSLVVFTIQDVLADPPFSRLDMVSCRNLLIYLRPEAQAKIVSIFHFALVTGGILLLGNAETAGNTDDRFEIVSKPNRIYRHIGQRRLGEFSFLANAGDSMRAPASPGQNQQPTRQAALAELCRRLVIASFAPAAVLVNRKNECLYSLGPTDRYLTVAPGHPTHDILAMARQNMRTKLRAAIQLATQDKQRVIVPGGRTDHSGHAVAFSIDVRPVVSDGEDLLLICCPDEPAQTHKHDRPIPAQDVSRVSELEQELEATRIELRGAIHNLEISGEEQTAINEEALSVNEEFQSTNEELLTSKEELQSLNEELTALNSQLQETLERQRTTANDLQNILYSTDVATLFLDINLKIRYFTPATKSLFSIIPGDIGRPLADLNLLAADHTLLSDARTMLLSKTPLEREIEAQSGAWYVRRILPYRTQDSGVEGVVITFTDITERKQAEKALETAKHEADLANAAKSRFLAAASHDLRQPLQTLTLLQGLLTKMDLGAPAQKLVTLLDPTLSAMSGMLNTLLDINQIDSGAVSATVVAFPIGNLLDRLRAEFTYHAHAQGLAFHVAPCSLVIESDPRLLEQMIRNLLANALKYTRKGKVLLGCRRRKGMVSIEIWDTGIGMPDTELHSIFDEYHQIDNPARERSQGLGLGLSIVRRLGDLLNHRIGVRSHLGKGSVFNIDVILPKAQRPAVPVQYERPIAPASAVKGPAGAILVIEDDPEVRELLKLFLNEDGHFTAMAHDGPKALELVAHGVIRPDLILADYNLPGGMDGIEATAKLREKLYGEIPVIILTGDISTDVLREIANHECVYLNKPVKLDELSRVINSLLLQSPPARLQGPEGGVIFVVDDNSHICDSIRGVLEDDNRVVETFSTGEDFLAAYRPGREGCLLVDAYLPGMSGIELLQRLRDDGHSLPSIMITGNSDVPMAVRAMKAGAADFIEKPIRRDELLAGIARALEQARDAGKLSAWREKAASHLAGLTPRQRTIMELVLAGHPSKNIAADLGISRRTVESHRAAIMKKTGSRSLPALARLALAAV